jgi:hypothetical protein
MGRNYTGRSEVYEDFWHTVYYGYVTLVKHAAELAHELHVQMRKSNNVSTILVSAYNDLVCCVITVPGHNALRFVARRRYYNDGTRGTILQ